jgi:hypothetical protein
MFVFLKTGKSSPYFYYFIISTGKRDHEVHKGHVVALEKIISLYCIHADRVEKY